MIRPYFFSLFYGHLICCCKENDSHYQVLDNVKQNSKYIHCSFLI